MKLTAEQQMMVADNHNLIYWYFNKYMSNGADISEYYDLLALELCYTIQKYVPEKGSLGNYYKLRADGLIYKEYRKTQAQKRLHINVSLVDNMNEDTTCADFHEITELNDWMNGENKEILTLKANGYSQTEIAEMLNVSQSYISKVLKRLKKEYMEREEN